MAKRVVVLTLRTISREVVGAMQRAQPDADVRGYDLESVRRDRRNS